jgi:exonuclease SbcD
VELERGAASWEFVEVDARRFVTVRADVRDADAPLETLRERIAKHDLEKAVVRLIVRMHAEQEPLLRDYDVRALLDDAYYIAGINREVERRARVRLGEQTPEEMSDRDLLATYLEVKETPSGRIETLLEHAEAIFQLADA